MSVVGTPTEWVDLIDPMVPQIIDLVLATWGAMPPPASDDREDDISNRLCAALRQSRNRTDYQFQIHPQSVILEPGADEELGRLDIAFWPLIPSEEVYFCLECKRLNVVCNGKTRAYCAEYVVHGMLRFVTGQYSRAVWHGGMLGYVLDGDVPGAMANVEENIRNRHAELGMQSPGSLGPSSIRQHDPFARETRHRRQQQKRLFRLHHLFLATATGKGPAATPKGSKAPMPPKAKPKSKGKKGGAGK